MSATKSNIEWTDATWNPTTGCTKVSPGCAHCYAESLTARYAGRPGWPAEFKPWTPANAAENVVLHPDRLEAPFSWRTPRRVFVNSMSDLFHEEIPDEFIDKVFAVMALTPQHTYQVLTKRPERMRAYMAGSSYARVRNEVDEGEVAHLHFKHLDTLGKSQAQKRWWTLLKEERWPLPNVWLGVTVENQRWADERIPILLDTPAAVRFVSAEPLLGPVDLSNIVNRFDPDFAPDALWRIDALRQEAWFLGESDSMDVYNDDGPGLDWVIVGGESGPKHRDFDPDWARSIVAQCKDAGVAVFVKQLGGARPGTNLADLPEDLRVREFPS